jgi:pimeloyl-ACP methyl ester carboxylesterase
MRGTTVLAFVFLSIASLALFFSSTAWAQKNVEGTAGSEPVFPAQWITVAGIKIYCVSMGQGQPLLLLHGLGGSWRDWSSTLPPLARSYQAIAIDFPGFGGSDKPETDYSIEWLTQIVEKLLEERKLSRVHVVGHSMGALVALNLAALPDSPVKRLVVADAIGIRDKSDFLSYALTKKIMGPESRWETVEGFMRDELRAIIENWLKSQTPKTSREFFESVPKSPLTGKPLLPMTPSVQMSASIIDFDIRPKLAAIRQPTLILWGGKDPIASPEDASFLKSQIPLAILKILEECGHSPMLEQPERFNRELEKFFQAAETDSPR